MTLRSFVQASANEVLKYRSQEDWRQTTVAARCCVQVHRTMTMLVSESSAVAPRRCNLISLLMLGAISIAVIIVVIIVIILVFVIIIVVIVVVVINRC